MRQSPVQLSTIQVESLQVSKRNHLPGNDAIYLHGLSKGKRFSQGLECDFNHAQTGMFASPQVNHPWPDRSICQFDGVECLGFEALPRQVEVDFS